MKRKTSPARAISLRLYFRVKRGSEIAFGPGKAELLALIGETGSINQAAKRMGMSYMRAWSLVQTMNRSFKQPLILSAHGGHERGGAELTETGRRVLECYGQMQAACFKACKGGWRSFQKLLRA